MSEPTSIQTVFEIVLNGARTKVAAGLPVDRLIAERVPGAPRGVAVAVNDEVVPRTQWATRRLKPGDTVEIVRATQGG
jgi:sulfur carrier protein